MLGTRPIASAPISSLFDNFQLFINETISLSETLKRIKEVGAIESITLGETAAGSSLTKSVSETITLSETVTQSSIINISETITLTEQVARRYDLAVTETIILGESKTVASDALEQTVIENIPLIEIIFGGHVVNRSLSETITLTEKAVRNKLFDCLENITLIEGIHLNINRRVDITETVLVTENYNLDGNNIGTTRRIYESISPIEVVAVHLIPKSGALEAITLSEAVSFRLIPSQTITEEITLVEDIEFRLLTQRLDDLITLFEIVELNIISLQSVCDCIIIGESVQRVKEATASDTLTLTEFATKNSITETLILTETIATNIVPGDCCSEAYVQGKGSSDILTLTEAVGLKRIINKTIIETLSVNDTTFLLP